MLDSFAELIKAIMSAFLLAHGIMAACICVVKNSDNYLVLAMGLIFIVSVFGRGRSSIERSLNIIYRTLP